LPWLRCLLAASKKKVLIADWISIMYRMEHRPSSSTIQCSSSSVHRWQGEETSIHSQNGGPKNVTRGQGFNVNVGWSWKGMSHRRQFQVWERTRADEGARKRTKTIDNFLVT
jgi:hypothetical protein